MWSCLGRHSDGSAEMRGAISDIHNAVKALQHLIVQLISLAKAERPKGETEDMGAFDLVDCTASTARSYATQALSRNMEISFESGCDHLCVCGSSLFAGR